MPNAYFCDAGEFDVVAEVIDYWPRYEPTFVNDVVFADTPGKAKALFCRRRNPEVMGAIEYPTVKVHVLARDVDREPGVAAWNDPLWEMVG